MKRLNLISHSIIGFLVTVVILITWLLFISFFTSPLKGYNEGYGTFFTRLFYYNQDITKPEVLLASPVILMQTNFLNSNPIIKIEGQGFGNNKKFFNVYRFPKHIGYWQFRTLAIQASLMLYLGEIAILSLITNKFSKNLPALIGMVYATTIFHFTLNILGFWVLTSIG